MRLHSGAIAALAALAVRVAAAQPGDERPRPFVVAAANSGIIGFTEGKSPQALIGAQAYMAFPRLIVGAQGGVTPGGGAPDVIYGMATLGYPAQAIRQSLIYPFVGLGGGVVDGTLSSRDGGVVLGAGVGADRVVGDEGVGLLVGVRGGYVMRQGDSSERALYLTVAIGGGGRRREPEKPPVIIASVARR